MGGSQRTSFDRWTEFAAARALRRLGFISTFLFIGLLTACGGGGGGGTPAPSAPASGVSGYVVKGPTAGATVNLFSVRTDGAKTLIATTTTDASGFYSFGVDPVPGTVLLVEASGGTYADEVTTARVPLGGMLRAVAVANGTPLRMSASPFSEIVVRDLELATTPNWSAAHADFYSSSMSDAIGVGNILGFSPVNMRDLPATAAASDDDFFMGLYLGGFSGTLRRLGNAPNLAPLSTGVAAMRTVFDDEYDDRYSPAFLLGMIDFIGVTALPADYKRRFKGTLLLRNENVSDNQIAAAMPTGVATGAASAPMPTNGFEIVPEPNFSYGSGVGTTFNSRGALVVLGNTNSGNYRYLHSASVGEVYGDGEIGIGRWHGGVSFTVRNGNSQSPDPEILGADNGFPYALAVPATNLPVCGKRTLALVGQTHPIQTAGTGFKPFTSFTPDSSIAVQYFGSFAAIGYDIGMQFSDNTTYRLKTPGGITDPWASPFRTGPDNSFQSFFYAPNPPSNMPSLYWDSNAILAGAGGRRAAFMIRVETGISDRETLAAAFSGPGILDESGCASGNQGDGSAISPPFAEGGYWVFAVISGNSTNMGAPVSATFRTDGSLLKASSLSVSNSAASFELAGNPEAFIGRVKGPFTFGGTNYNQSLPFAVAKPAGTLPTTGTRHYRLVNASAVVTTVGTGSAISELPSGTISTASLDINFGEWPAGTPSDYYGSVSMLIEGTVAGEHFTISNPFTGTFNDSRYSRDSGNFSEGAISGPNAEYAVVRYMTNIGAASVQGVVLFQAE